MSNLNNMTRDELADELNALTGASVKPTSYTKKVFIQKIEAASDEAPTPVETDPAEEPSVPEVDESIDVPCPKCDFVGGLEDFELLGAVGTPLGACGTCPECKTSFNLMTGTPVETPKAAGKRKILNPQPVINAKTSFLAEKVEAILFYDREERLWTITHDKLEDALYLTSAELAHYSKQDLVKIIRGKLKMK